MKTKSATNNCALVRYAIQELRRPTRGFVHINSIHAFVRRSVGSYLDPKLLSKCVHRMARNGQLLRWQRSSVPRYALPSAKATAKTSQATSSSTKSTRAPQRRSLKATRRRDSFARSEDLSAHLRPSVASPSSTSALTAACDITTPHRSSSTSASPASSSRKPPSKELSYLTPILLQPVYSAADMQRLQRELRQCHHEIDHLKKELMLATSRASTVHAQPAQVVTSESECMPSTYIPELVPVVESHSCDQHGTKTIPERTPSFHGNISVARRLLFDNSSTNDTDDQHPPHVAELADDMEAWAPLPSDSCAVPAVPAVYAASDNNAEVDMAPASSSKDASSAASMWGQSVVASNGNSAIPCEVVIIEDRTSYHDSSFMAVVTEKDHQVDEHDDRDDDGDMACDHDMDSDYDDDHGVDFGGLEDLVLPPIDSQQRDANTDAAFSVDIGIDVCEPHPSSSTSSPSPSVPMASSPVSVSCSVPAAESAAETFESVVFDDAAGNGADNTPFFDAVAGNIGDISRSQEQLAEHNDQQQQPSLRSEGMGSFEQNHSQQQSILDLYVASKILLRNESVRSVDTAINDASDYPSCAQLEQPSSPAPAPAPLPLPPTSPVRMPLSPSRITSSTSLPTSPSSTRISSPVQHSPSCTQQTQTRASSPLPATSPSRILSPPSLSIHRHHNKEQCVARYTVLQQKLASQRAAMRICRQRALALMQSIDAFPMDEEEDEDDTMDF